MIQQSKSISSRTKPMQGTWFAMLLYGGFLFFVYAWLSVLEERFGGWGRVRVLLAALLFVLCFARLLYHGGFTAFFRSKAVLAAGCYLAIETVSGLGLGERAFVLQTLRSNLTLVSIAFWTYCIFSTRSLMRCLAPLLVVVVVCVAAVSFRGFTVSSAEGRLQAGIGEMRDNPNDTAMVYGWGVGLVLGIILARRSLWQKFLAAAGGGVLILGIFYTGSRGAVLLLVALLVVFFGSWRVRVGGRILVALVGLCLLVGTAQFLKSLPNLPFGVQRALSVFTFDVGTAPELAETGSVDSRMPLYQAAWRAWLQNPITGIGTGNFQTQSGRYFGVNSEYEGTATHNTYFQILAELGLVGFLCFGWWLYALYRTVAHGEFRVFNWILFVAVLGGFNSNLVAGWHVMFVLTGAAARIESLRRLPGAVDCPPRLASKRGPQVPARFPRRTRAMELPERRKVAVGANDVTGAATL